MIFFESETLVLSDATEKSITGVHTWVFQQVKIKRTKRWLDGTWRQEGAERALKAGGTHTTRTYIDKRQVIVAHWVDLRTIFEVCMQEGEVRKRGEETGPVVEADGGGYPIEGHVKRDFSGHKGAEAIGIH